jgi:predicted  nucleic acid-binding Zn-ribbon protein
VGRIGPGLVEGSLVKAGDFIMSIEPLAAGLKDQLDLQKKQLEFKLEFAKKGITAFEGQKQAYESARDFAVEAADQQVLGAKNKLAAKELEVEAYAAKERQAKLDLDRQTKLVNEGIRADRDFEKIRAEHESALALLNAIKKDVDAAGNEVTSKEKEREQKRLEATTKVDYAEATLQKARGDAATIEKELSEIKVKLEELDRKMARSFGYRFSSKASRSKKVTSYSRLCRTRRITRSNCTCRETIYPWCRLGLRCDYSLKAGRRCNLWAGRRSRLDLLVAWWRPSMQPTTARANFACWFVQRNRNLGHLAFICDRVSARMAGSCWAKSHYGLSYGDN